MNNTASIFLVILLLITLWIIAIQIVDAQNNMLNSDFFKFWLAGRMIGQGDNPYNADAWVENHHVYGSEWIPEQTFIYPLPFAILFVPLGVLHLKLASTIWVFLTLVMILASVVLIQDLWMLPFRWSVFLPILAGVFTFRPVLVTLHNGQIGGLWLFLVTFCLWLWKRDYWLAGGLLLPIFILKPTFGIILVGLIILWLIISNHRPALLGIFLTSLLLLIASWLLDPGWISNFLSIGKSRYIGNNWFFPSLWGFIYMISNSDIQTSLSAYIFLGGLLVGVLVLIFIYGRDRLTNDGMMSLVIATAILLAPYLWAYDQILLLIPILHMTGTLLIGKFPYLVSVTFPLVVSILSLILLVFAYHFGNDSWSVWLTMVSLGMSFLALKWRATSLTLERT